MPGRLLDLIRRRARHIVSSREQRARAATWPHMGLGLGALADYYRSRQELVAENQLLRQQVILLRRQISKPRLAPRDRVSLVLLASLTKTWAGAMLLVKPDTILRWHREGFRLFWKRKSRSKNRKSRVPETTIALIRQMARNSKLWGAERIRGELLKLGIRRAKTTIQKYMRAVRRRAPRGQSWKTFIHNQGLHIWSCDFLQTYDVFFRPIFAFFIIEGAANPRVTPPRIRPRYRQDELLDLAESGSPPAGNRLHLVGFGSPNRPRPQEHTGGKMWS